MRDEPRILAQKTGPPVTTDLAAATTTATTAAAATTTATEVAATATTATTAATAASATAAETGELDDRTRSALKTDRGKNDTSFQVFKGKPPAPGATRLRR